MAKLKRIHFEDHGQDFLFWVVDSEGKVIQCEPYQHWIWSKVRVIGHSDGYVHYEDKEGTTRTIKYPIEKIEEVRVYIYTSIDDAKSSIKLGLEQGYIPLGTLEANLAAELARQEPRTSLVNFLESKIRVLKKKGGATC